MAAKSELVIHSTERAPGAELTGIYYCHYRENCHFQTFDLELLKNIYYTKNYIKIPMTQKTHLLHGKNSNNNKENPTKLLF